LTNDLHHVDFLSVPKLQMLLFENPLQSAYSELL